jgi:hypothetical protein
MLKQAVLGFFFCLLFMMSIYCSYSFAKQREMLWRDSNPYIPTLDVAQYALHQGDARSANLVESFIPLLSTSNSLPFLDVRFYNPNGTPIEGNIDIGFRRLFHQNSRLFGLYAGYDRYRSETRRYYSQANAGIEIWLNRFFLGGNVYIPFGKKVYDNNAFNIAYLVPVNDFRYNISYEQGKERALPGMDAEIGFDVTSGLTVYGGGYYFDHSNARRIAGPKLRATYTFYRAQSHWFLNIFDRIRLEGLLSHDSVRGTSWMAGVRFRFGLSKHTNPSTNLARHMTDPIRRDLNVVNENFNASPERLQINGHLALVDLVNGADRTINDAVDGVDSAADIIGVLGNQTATTELNVGERQLAVTGGNYEFSIGGHPYTVYNLGRNGAVTSVAGAGRSAFIVVINPADITLEHLDLVQNASNNDQFALQSSGGSFGHLTLKDVNSNMPINLYLDNTDLNGAGQLTFVNNHITLEDSMATVTHGGGRLTCLALVVSGTSNQLLTVSRFKNNQMDITNTTTSQTSNGLYVRSQSNNPITFTTGVQHNIISVESSAAIIPGVRITGLYADFVSSKGDFSDNQIMTQGLSIGSMPALYTTGGTFSLENSNFMNNQFTAKKSNYGNAIGWEQDSTAIIGRDFRGNTFVASNSSSAGRGMNSAGSLYIGGDFSDNDFTASNNGGASFAWKSSNVIEVGSNFSNNIFIANDNASGTPFATDAWNSSGNVTIGNNFSGNQFTASRNGSAPAKTTQGWQVEGGDVIIQGSFINNKFDVSYNDGSQNGWLNANSTSVTIVGDFTGNEFSASHSIDSSHNGCGWTLKDVSIGGDFSDNIFITEFITGSFADGIFIQGPFTLGGDFTGNQFNISNNESGGNGIRVSAGSNPLTIGGSFSQNIFTLYQNGSAVGWANVISGGISIEGDFMGNQFILYDNTSSSSGLNTSNATFTLAGDFIENQFMISGSGSNNGAIGIANSATFNGFFENNSMVVDFDTSGRGLRIDVDTGEIVTFEKVVRGNIMKINGSNAGIYGFELDTAGDGDIYFNGNTEANLISLNHNASVDPSGTGIHYNG